MAEKGVTIDDVTGGSARRTCRVCGWLGGRGCITLGDHGKALRMAGSDSPGDDGLRYAF